MKQKLAEFIVEAGSQQGIECRLYEDYSGRGMYGDKTTGVVVGNVADLLEAVIIHTAECAQDNDKEFDDFIFEIEDSSGRLHTDSLAYEVIIY